MKDLYNIKSNKFEYVSYRSQDIFFNEEDECKKFKDSAGCLKITQADSNEIRCHTNTGIAFDKEIISDKIAVESRVNGFCSQVQKSYLFNFNRLLTEAIIKLGGNKLDLVSNFHFYTNPFYYKDYKKEYGEYYKMKELDVANAIDNRNISLDFGKIIKVEKTLKGLKQDLDDNFIGFYDSLSNSEKDLYEIPELKEKYSVLYVTCLSQKLTDKNYNNRRSLENYSGYIDLNKIWRDFKIPENYTYQDFINKIEEIKFNNYKILEESNYPTEKLADVIAWNFIEKLTYNKKDKVFLKYLIEYNNLKNSTWAVLDKNYALKNNIIFIMATSKTECKKVMKLFQLSGPVLFDSIKKQFLIPIKFKEKVYDKAIEYIQNTIKAKGIKALCLELYQDTTVANIDNKSVKLVDISSWKEITESKEIIFEPKNNPVLNHIANPYKFSKPECLNGIRIELSIKSEIKRNPYGLGWKKSKIIAKDNGELIYQENEDPKKLVGINFLNYIENSYLGKKINKYNEIFEEINKKLKKNGKPQISEKISRNLMHLIFANFAKAGLDLVTYNRNVISSDSNYNRKNQTYYMSALVRALIIKESIIQFASNTDLSVFSSKEEFDQIMKILTRYETALAIYKTINEEFFHLNKIKVKGDLYSSADISLSYESDLEKIKRAFSRIPGLDVNQIILEKETKESWASSIICKLNEKELKELKVNAGVDLYKTCKTIKEQRIILAIRSCFTLYFDLIIKFYDRIKYKLNRSNLLNQILCTELKLPYYLKSELWT